METTMTLTPRQLKERHDEYVAKRMRGWDADTMAAAYTLDELALHVMLSHEMFYCQEVRRQQEENALRYLRSAYPNATNEDMRRVYEEFREVVAEVYG